MHPFILAFLASFAFGFIALSAMSVSDKVPYANGSHSLKVLTKNSVFIASSLFTFILLFIGILLMSHYDIGQIAFGVLLILCIVVMYLYGLWSDNNGTRLFFKVFVQLTTVLLYVVAMPENLSAKTIFVGKAADSAIEVVAGVVFMNLIAHVVHDFMVLSILAFLIMLITLPIYIEQHEQVHALCGSSFLGGLMAFIVKCNKFSDCKRNNAVCFPLEFLTTISFLQFIDLIFN